MLALIDSGCTTSTISLQLLGKYCVGADVPIITAGSEKVFGKNVRIKVGVNDQEFEVSCLCVASPVAGFHFVLGNDIIARCGGVFVDGRGSHAFGPKVLTACVASAPVVEIDESDFSAIFDGFNWEAKWKWRNEPPIVRGPANYGIAESVREAYEQEVSDWIESGWLVPYTAELEAELGPPVGLIPLMAIVQENKNKVRPVLDYRQLNKNIESFSGSNDVCAEKLRNWRKLGPKCAILDLRKAYLQIRIHRSLWSSQVVTFKGTRYALTRLGFGLVSAPKIMTRILKKTLSMDSKIAAACDHILTI